MTNERIFALNDEGGLEERRERIVRCRDCKHAEEYCDTDMLGCLHFEQWDYCEDQPRQWLVEPDGFCAWGEPRKED